MTSDKQNNGYPAKPFTPTLSAAFHRNKKAPLTPKLASPSPGHPATRRLAHPDHPYSTPIKDEITAVPSTFLSTNVTPRSGSRTTRRDTAFASPTNTPPTPSPQIPYSQPTVGLGLQGARRTERSPARGVKPEQSRSLRAKTLTAEGSQVSRPNSFSDMAAASPMFFHASDARSTASSDLDTSRPRPGQAPLQAPAQGRMSPASSFMYANGDQDRQAADDSYFLSTGKRRSGGLPRPTPARSAISPSPRLMKSPRPSDATSPLADDTHSQPSPNPDMSFDNILHRFDSPPSIIPDRPQRPSIGRHTKSISIDSASNISFSQDSLRASPIIVSNNLNDGTTPVMSDPIPTLRPRIFSNGSSVSTNPPMSIPVSPGKSEVGEGALNARTERKILDLEISNSSLLAINRTLEREMRNQKAELRRFRRLSRSGRLSMAPSARSFSGTALSTTSEMEGVSELSSIRSQDDMSDYSDEDSIADEGILSPGSLAEHDAKHRAHDEKRFMVDLARHQELLVDSQKMNQSLKRCLGWTEELIKEGQKALEYSVHVQDIELGGRVLSPEELGEVGESGRALLSPSTEFAAFPPHDTPSDSFFDFDAATLPLPSSPGGTDLIF
ncbi:hypothetical protein N7448_001953 [Penicillium atrosanguineum]|uniref:uncharacterized protein n=1 Tax=Penicillium atrosanguineum TaxID=1132637 RepID=UPI00239959FF|nr:uncharacterized protein N7443_005353 [Penicillium atrosanguineum]KAJ5128235.1 hypothetical protein N7526_006401 [Penicillium atrosanguineum]KAJ5144561.1 hypothetical protein N7448_001953 [Penicillium atrosanguineum]KAJ5300351.1 hypothetical protein N7443_005353 [Penicillium atrosanguineum]